MTQLLHIFDDVFRQQKKAAGRWTCRLFQLVDRLACGGVTFVGTRTANTAARLRRFVGIVGFRMDWAAVVIVARDRRRQDGEIDPLIVIVIASVLTRRPVFTRRAVFTRPSVVIAVAIAFVRRPAIGPIAAWLGPINIASIDIGSVTAWLGAVAIGTWAAGSLRLLFIRPTALGLIVAITVEIAVPVIVHVGVHPIVAVIILVIIAAAALLFVEARAGIAEHAEIMIRKLQIIFGLDSITSKLGVARHALILFEQLCCIAALAIVLPVAAIVIAGHAPGLLPTTAATAAGLTIIDQAKFPRRTGAMAPQNHSLEGQSFIPPAVLRADRAGAPVSLCAHD